jgi:hypothetical protein
MLRFVYRWLLRLHPARFRERFAEEMMSIFDHAAEKQAAAKLLVDGFISLLRQWTMRSEYWEEKATGRAHSAANGVPLFYTFESFKPRTSALIDGGILAVVLFCAVCLVLRYNWTHPVSIPFNGSQFESSWDVEPSATSLLSPAGATSINPQQQQISPEFERRTPKAVPPTFGRPVPPQPPTPGTLSDTRPRDRFGTEVPPHPVMSAAAPSSPPSVAHTIFPPNLREEKLKSYAGVYATDPPNELTILITAEDGQLAIEVAGEPKHILVPTSGTKFVVSGATDTRIDFVRNYDRAEYELDIYRNGYHLTAHHNTK